MKNVIFDLDGTLADIEHRRHHVVKPNRNWKAFYEECINDEPKTEIIKLCNILHRTHFIRIWSGRSTAVMGQTKEWLKKYKVKYNELLMRPEGDYTPDEKLKEGWLNVIGSSTVFLVFDDRNKVVDMWRRHGITCCQVAPGDF